MPHRIIAIAITLLFAPLIRAADPADLIVHNAKIVTVDAKFTTAEAIAIHKGRIVAVGKNPDVLAFKGPQTKVIDAGGKTVLPGLYDSHVHPMGAAISEANAPLPLLQSLPEVFQFLREKVKSTPKGEWIVIRYAFPTRLKEARFPTKAELDEVAPDHPVLYHAGPAGVVNSMGLKISGVTRDTPHPRAGMVVKDPKTGEPTGMIRNAYGVLKNVPSESENLTADQKRAAVKKLFRLYNEQGLTSVADRSAGRDSLDMYIGLASKNELTVRVNVARGFGASGSRDAIAKRFDELPGADKRGGPTGVGDDWVRIGPIKLFLDGGMLNGSAYMRQPWPKGDTYQITEDDYRGLLFIEPEQLRIVLEEGVKRKWQMTAHTAGEGGMDVLLDAYEQVNRITPIRDLRMCITHANFPSKMNLERCKALNVVADVQPAWLWKDGNTLRNVLGEERIRWFQPYKSWLDYTVIGGGSDHMLRYDSLISTNPWNPWLGIWVAITRKTERGAVLRPDECLSREQAIRLYTIHNAYICNEEKDKGSLENGKFGDLIIVDRDVMTCPVDDIRETKVISTIVGGKVVYQRGE